MTVTFTFNNMLLAIAVAAIVIGVVYLVATLKKLEAVRSANSPIWYSSKGSEPSTAT